MTQDSLPNLEISQEGRLLLMNKRKMLMVCMMVLAVSLSACGKKNVEETQQTETTMTETMPTVQPTETEWETIPGLAPFDGDVELDDGPDAQETTAPTVAATESKDQSNNTSTPKPTTPKPTEPKPTEPKPTEPKPTEPKPTEPKPTEPKPTEPKPTEPKPTEPNNQGTAEGIFGSNETDERGF